MHLKLKDIPVVFISPNTPGRYATRYQHMLQILQGWQVKHCQAVAHPVKLISGALSFINALTANMETPVIILEDDCSWYETPPETLHIPDDADAVYLGLSKARVHPDYDWGIANPTITAVTEYPHLVRIHDMLSMHAILYISKEFKEKCIQGLQAFVRHVTDGWDIPIARLQQIYTVYALKIPLLYQDATYQGNEESTRWHINENYV